MLFFSAHLNYFGHLDPKSKVCQPTNVAQSGIVRLANLLSQNLWYHENHHTNPRPLNPKNDQTAGGVVTLDEGHAAQDVLDSVQAAAE